MSEQGQIGQLHAVILQNLPEMTMRQRQDWISNPKGLKRFLSFLVESVDKIAHCIIASFNDLIDYSQPIAGLIDKGKYDLVDINITDKNFPSTETGRRKIEEVVFYFNRNISYENAMMEIDNAGCRQASPKELLNFGEKHPETQRKYPVVALGADWNGQVCFLGQNGSKRSLGLYHLKDGWCGHYCFLGIRLSL